MAVTPTGAPAWVRANDHATYGGDVNKRDYQSIGVVNPRTDISAAQFCRLAADLAAVQLVAPFASITYLCNDTTPAAPTIEALDSMVAAPTTTRIGNGVVEFAWETSYLDAYGVSGAVNIVHAIASAHSTSSIRNPTVEKVDAQTIRVYAWDSAGAALSDARVTLIVQTGQ